MKFQAIPPRLRFVDNNGNALAGGKVYTYTAGTTTPLATYTDSTGATANANPVILDSRGEADIWLSDDRYYKFVVKTSADVEIDTTDNISNAITSQSTPVYHGAVGDGVEVDTTAMNAMIAAQPIRTYLFGGVDIGHNQYLDLEFEKAKGTASAYMIALEGYASSVARVYVSDASASTVAMKFASGGRFNRLTDSFILNAQTAILFDPGAGSNDRAMISDVHVETYTVDGVFVDSNVSEIDVCNLYLDSGIEIANNRPKRGTNGWRQNTPVVTTAVGGHLLTNVTVINCETGFYFTDAKLTSLQNCVADSTAGYGLKMDGACSDVEISNLFVGSSMGVYIGGTSQDITINGLRTRLIGTTPPWGGANFYLTAGPYYAVTVADTAKLTIDGDEWYGEKTISVASGATLNIKGGVRRSWDTNATVAAGTTTYLDDDGNSATEGDTVLRMPYNGYLVGLECYADTAPVGAETFVYTARASASDTALTATITGSDTSKTVWSGTALFYAKGTAITVSLVTSGGAAAARHTGHLLILGV